jgi:hypothetical protein
MIHSSDFDEPLELAQQSSGHSRPLSFVSRSSHSHNASLCFASSAAGGVVPILLHGMKNCREMRCKRSTCHEARTLPFASRVSGDVPAYSWGKAPYAAGN